MVLLKYDILNIIFLSIGIIISSIFFYTLIISILEKEYRAVKVSFLLSITTISIFLTIHLYNFKHKPIVLIILLSIIILLVLILFLPIQFKLSPKSISSPQQKHDERDIIFSRNELIPETERFKNYYKNNPEKELIDNKFRSKPGLLSPKSSFYEPFSYAAAHANLQLIEVLKPHINGEIAEKKQTVDASKITNYIKNWGKLLGTHSIGITQLKEHHLYSHKGRGNTYGKAITNSHHYAIALTIEMNNEMVKTAPQGTIIMESTQQYLSSGTIALQIAGFIRNLGYSAQAHIDGSYELICPLVAKDAGLGEIGRMGLLMTPKLGPRVRIAVVTTDIPLELSKTPDYSSIIDFCRICKKCADACPSRSIPFNDREKTNNTLRWKINSESCFTYWCTIGTDCGRCMSVCPYSHPNNFLHNFIRFGIANSYIFRRFALIMDDLFYGRKPKSWKLPKWIS
ncbi:MAG: reductive dehalogenase [Bacteroidales bacterium]|nr:reductive dehalogenase [Bacteroidales bacterium]